MTYNPTTRTFDCDLTLTDRQVLGFCREGYLILERVVDDGTNRLTLAERNGAARSP